MSLGVSEPGTHSPPGARARVAELASGPGEGQGEARRTHCLGVDERRAQGQGSGRSQVTGTEKKPSGARARQERMVIGVSYWPYLTSHHRCK